MPLTILRSLMQIFVGVLLIVQTVRVTDKQAEIDALKAEIERSAAVAKAEAEVLQNEIQSITERAENAQRAAQATVAGLRADVADGIVRLRKCTDTRADVPAAAGAQDRKDDARSVDKIADNLVGIAADGDEAIRRLNACIDAYNAARERVNRGAGALK